MMSPILLQTFAFMACTFALGLFMGWVIWRLGAVTSKDLENLETEVKYWRGSHEKSRMELWEEQEKLSALNDETTKLRKRVSAITA